MRPILLFLLIFFLHFAQAQITISSPVTISICDSDSNGYETITFSDYNNMFSTNPSYSFSYFVSKSDAENNVNPFSSTLDLTGSNSFFVRVESPGENFVIGTLTIFLYADCNMGIYEVHSENIQVYPNPTEDFLRINTKSKFRRAEFLSLNGDKILDSTTENINLSKVKSGVYILKVITNQSEESFKIIKK